MPQALHTLRTIVVTATVTSAGWVTAGALWLDKGRSAPPEGPAMSLMAAAPGQSGRPMPAPASTAQARAAMRAMPSGRLVIPVEGVRADMLVDTFTQARDGGIRVHDAIDILAPRGTPVVAAAPGRVERLFLSKAGGITVYQRSPDGNLVYYYAHLDGYAPGLGEGQALRAGDPIGFVGSTGNADPSAPHLHFAVTQTAPQAKWSEPGTALNPYPMLGGR